MTTRHIHVSCAIIEHNGQTLAAQRSATQSLPLKWEFPGGKIEPGETPRQCLERELMEELGITVHVGPALTPVTHHYPAFSITLYPFICVLKQETIHPREHAAIAWLKPDKLPNLDWAEADGPILAEYLSNAPSCSAP